MWDWCRWRSPAGIGDGWDSTKAKAVNGPTPGCVIMGADIVMESISLTTSPSRGSSDYPTIVKGCPEFQGARFWDAAVGNARVKEEDWSGR